jgi:hypothetical protein
MLLILCAIVPALISCDLKKSPGTFTLNFVWPEGVKPSPTLALYARAVLSWEGGSEANKNGEVALGAGTPEITFGGLNYDREYVLTVEIFEKSPKDAVVYFGKSAGFTLTAGKDVAVEVAVPLKPAPGRKNDGTVAPLNLSIPQSLNGYVGAENVTLHVHAENAQTVTISNSAAFRESADRDLSGQGTAVDFDTPWNLNDGLAETVKATDGERTVFAKLSNAGDYETDPEPVTVTLDRMAPDVFPDSVSMTITPPGACVLAPNEVIALAKGSTATVSFTLTEIVDGTPDLVAKNGATELTFGIATSVGTTWQMTYTVPEADAGVAEGEYELWLHIKDPAGHENAVKPGKFLDVEPKFRVILADPVLTIDQTKVTYLRSPWGNGVDEKLDPADPNSLVIPADPYYSLAPANPRENTRSLPASTFLLQDGSMPAMLRVWTSEEMTDELGSLTPNPNGTWPRKELRKLDTPVVWASAANPACRESAPQKVQNVEWVATMNGKVPGSTFENPHRFESRTWFTGFLTQVDAAEGGAANGLAAVGPPLLDFRGRGAWRKRRFENPSARSQHALAFDSARGRLVLFGGYRDGSFNDETWEWDGCSWGEKVPTDPEGDGNPSARSGHSMAYDSARGRVVLFGGSPGAARLNDETWEWDGMSWAKKTPVDPEGDGNPSARSGHSMVYDSVRGRLVLFGGAAGGYDDETWEWDGMSWAKKTPVDPEGDGNPSARFQHGMAFDSNREKVVLFGGYDVTTFLFDTWEWDGVSWAKKIPRDTEGDGNPSARHGHMAFDSARRRVVLFGGYFGSGWSDETWEWDGTSWARKTPADPEGDANPLAREAHSITYDALRGMVVLFGGSTGVFNDETWDWDGVSWKMAMLVDPEGDGNPSARYGHQVVFDSERGKAVLFGGYDGAIKEDTWEWDGASWAKKTPGDPEGDGNPSARYYYAMAYDESRGKAVVFGGLDSSYSPKEETWEWDGASWAKKTPGDPEGDGNPSARWGCAMAYDGAREKLVLFGGYDGTYWNWETWEWDGVSWSNKTPADPEGDGNPSGRYMHAMANESATGKIVLFGGTRDFSSGRNNDTWEWDGGATSRTGQVMKATFGAAGLNEFPNVQSAGVTFFSGSVGYPSGVERAGAELKIWDEGMWKTVASNSSGPEGPSHISWSTDTDPYWSNLRASDPAAFQNNIRRLFFGDQQTLNFAVTPVAPNGTGTGVVATDYVEVVVKYRQQ